MVVIDVAVHLDGEARARFHGDAVEEHRAGAALAGVAADLGAGEPGELADEVHEQRARLDVPLVGAAVDRQSDRHCHDIPPNRTCVQS